MKHVVCQQVSTTHMKIDIITIVFREWFWEKYEKFRKGTNNGPTAFARYLGIKQQHVSAWLNGEYTPKSHEHISKLAEKYPDVYLALGLPDPLASLPPEFAQRIRRAVVEIRETIEQEGVKVDSPRAEEIRNSIMAKYGLVRTSTE